MDAEITGALRSLVEFLAVDRSTLFQWSADGRILENTHQWVVEGCEPIPPVIPSEVLPYSLRRVLEGQPFWFSNLTELPPEAAVDRAFFEKHGPKSNLSFPLVAGGSVVGALAFGAVRHERQWPEVLRDRLSAVAHVFANALERKRSDLALQHAYAEVTQLKERLELDNQYLRQELAADAGDDAIVAQSAAMKDRAARSQAGGRHRFHRAVVRRDGHGQGAPRGSRASGQQTKGPVAGPRQLRGVARAR